MLINTKLHSKSCRYLNLYGALGTYSFPVARGIFCGIDLSCFVPQSADTKLLMIPLRTLHWHCWGHSDKQKQASIKNWYLNHICLFESNWWWHVTKYTIRLAKHCSKSSKTKMLSRRNGRHISHHIFYFYSAVGAKQLIIITNMIFIRHVWKWSKILNYWDLLFFGILRLICWKITLICCKFCRWCLLHRLKKIEPTFNSHFQRDPNRLTY